MVDLRVQKRLRPDKFAEHEAQVRFADLLRGRRVVIVGPADTTQGTGRGALIDAYDFVVRINGQWPVAPKLAADIGRRADILYHCCNGYSPIEPLNVPNFARLRFVWYESNAEAVLLSGLCRLHSVNHGSYDELRDSMMRELGTAPNTGTIAIGHLLRTELSELHVTGFSFYLTRYYKGYRGWGANPRHWRWWNKHRGKRMGMHHFEPQREYFLCLRACDSRISIDPALEALLAGLSA